MKTAIILNCGEKIVRKINADKIICCDGGYNVADVKPDVILGDLDSIALPPDFDESETEIVEFPSHKDASDSELAVYYAKETLHSDEVVFYGVLGGRYDHVLCNFSVMKLAANLGMSVKAEENGLDLYFVDGEKDIPSVKGEIISIIPFGSNAIVTCSNNLEYPLDNLLLSSASARGLSNVSLGGKVHIKVSSGGVLVFRYIKGF